MLVRCSSQRCCFSVECYLPSTCIINCFSIHTTSTIYVSITYCRLNLTPNCFLRISFHKILSASVGFFRISLASFFKKGYDTRSANSYGLSITSFFFHQSLPLKGRLGRVFFPLKGRLGRVILKGEAIGVTIPPLEGEVR